MLFSSADDLHEDFPHPIWHSQELSQRVDVVSFSRYLCDALEAVRIASDSGVSEMCATHVEPLCQRLEAAAVAGLIPTSVKVTMKALSRTNSRITPQDFIAESVVPRIAQWIFGKQIEMTGADEDNVEMLTAMVYFQWSHRGDAHSYSASSLPWSGGESGGAAVSLFGPRGERADFVA